MQRSWCWRIVFAVDVETCSCCQTGSSPSRCRACPDVHFGWTIATFAWQRVNPNMCLCYVLSRNVLWLFIYAHILIHIIAHKYIYIHTYIYYNLIFLSMLCRTSCWSSPSGRGRWRGGFILCALEVRLKKLSPSRCGEKNVGKTVKPNSKPLFFDILSGFTIGFYYDYYRIPMNICLIMICCMIIAAIK